MISVSLIMVPVCAGGLILAHCDGKVSSENWKEGTYPRDYQHVCAALTSSLSLNFHSRERAVKDTFPSSSKTDSQTGLWLLHHIQVSIAQVWRAIID